jgi:hypothetical protein
MKTFIIWILSVALLSFVLPTRYAISYDSDLQDAVDSLKLPDNLDETLDSISALKFRQFSPEDQSPSEWDIIDQGELNRAVEDWDRQFEDEPNENYFQ